MRTDPVNTVRIFRTMPPSARWGQNTAYNGAVTMDIRSPGPEATLPKNACAAVLNMVATCVRLPDCNQGRIFDNFATAGQRYFNSLEEMPVFSSQNFYSVCTTVCMRKLYVAKQARSILCGY